ncbi:hypothetical protein DFJ73DRAFT_871633 [Zopfochytrium polystomum]|nr:hypothetical protein DFJ73DRAFT_871633 [Zopfochytrium polystomum]
MEAIVEIPNANNAGVWCADVDADATVIVTGSLDQAVRLWMQRRASAPSSWRVNRSPVEQHLKRDCGIETRGALLHNFDNATESLRLERERSWHFPHFPETARNVRPHFGGGWWPNPVLELAKLHTWGTRFAVESMAPARHFCVYDTQTRALVSTLPPPGSGWGMGKDSKFGTLNRGESFSDFQVHGELNVAVGRNEICYVDNYRVEWMEMNFGLGIPYSNEF